MAEHARPDEQPTVKRALHALGGQKGAARQARVASVAALGAVVLAAGCFAGWRAVALPQDPKASRGTVAPVLATWDLNAVPACCADAFGSAGGPGPYLLEAENQSGSALPIGIEERLAACEPYAASLADIAALPGQAEPFAFCLNSASANAAPALADETIANLQAACAPFAQQGCQAGYLLLDLETGRGLAGNVDARVYGASSFKGPFALYLCESWLDTGRAALDAWCPESAAAPYMDYDGGYLRDGASAYPLGDLVSESIVLSGNDPYRILRANYDGDDLRAWLVNLGVSADVGNEWYPAYSARESAQLWLHAADYLAGDGVSAPWLASLLAQAETSFIRNALAAEGASVRGKAGWNADADPAYCGICDAGIVTVEGRDYLLSVMSSAPHSANNVAAVEEVVAAVFAAREDLA